MSNPKPSAEERSIEELAERQALRWFKGGEPYPLFLRDVLAPFFREAERAAETAAREGWPVSPDGHRITQEQVRAMGDRIADLEEALQIIAHWEDDPKNSSPFTFAKTALDNAGQINRGPLSEQIDQLASFIMAEVGGEPLQSEGAVECAIRIIRELKREVERLNRERLVFVKDGTMVLLTIEQIQEAARADGGREGRTPGTKIVCLCGSTRFTEQMLIKQWELTKQGVIVVTWCALPDSYIRNPERADAFSNDPFHIGDKEGVKEAIDELHKRKIDLADEVFVLNIDGYIGESTSSEIAYAEKTGKPVKYLEPDIRTLAESEKGEG